MGGRDIIYTSGYVHIYNITLSLIGDNVSDGGLPTDFVEDCMQILVWTILPDPDGHLGFAGIGNLSQSELLSDSFGGTSQERLQYRLEYRPESDDDTPGRD